ncbi:hypothetical protein ACFFLS_07105 [Flavobacterium procerum]|uniref:Ig-like domain-containing protein n=1 Tax=Flavobacterium procerum TaxID=1455569 RepID=A0ABV6BMX9_9FLAO
MIQNFNKTGKTGFCFALLLVMLFWFPAKIQAQEAQATQYDPLWYYTHEAESSTFVPLTGGTAVSAVNADNAGKGSLPIGFNFTIGTANYSTFYASSNGYITLGGSISTTYSTASATALAAVNSGRALLAPLWADLNGATTGSFSYKTTGTAPNRVLTAEWKNWKWDYTATAAVISFQVKLYEGTNTIEYVYNQEANAVVKSAGYEAAIGLYFNYNRIYKQLWLTDSGSNPGKSEALVLPIIDRPASGQLYRFKLNSAGTFYYGRTVINPNGGVLTNGSDGLKIILTGAGNMQVYRKNVGQVYYAGDILPTGTSDPYLTPGTIHGLVLSVGSTTFAGGELYPNTLDQRLNIISNTKQSDIQNGNTYTNVIKLLAVKNGMNYILEVTYTYIYPDSKFRIDYKVTIPDSNTENVRLAHAYDPSMPDRCPGFVAGTAPYFTVGATISSQYEAFHYLDGVPWSGYYSARTLPLSSDLGSTTPNPWMAFNNTIDPTNNIDNGIGISMNFGSTPGTFTSSNMLVYACPAGDTAPILTGTTAKICTGATFNLNNFVTSTPPAETILQWKNASGVIVPDPTNVTATGKYTVSYYAADYGCASSTASITISNDATCCFKTGVTAGTTEPIKTIISSLDRVAVPRNMSDPRAGSLILESSTKGFVLTRIASPETAITTPVEGMLVYDTVAKVLKMYNGTVWRVLVQSCPD